MLSEKKNLSSEDPKVIMKNSICQSRNVRNCCANEIEMKGFNAKMGN